MQNKGLIINADEFGAARCVTDAVWKCLNKGVLTSTTIVDLGCAGGCLCSELVRYGAVKVIGIDIAPTAIEPARNHD